MDFYEKLRKIELELLALKTAHNSMIRTGSSAPTSSTAGKVGSLYTWVSGSTGHLAICTNASGSTYTWQTIV